MFSRIFRQFFFAITVAIVVTLVLVDNPVSPARTS